MNLDYNAFEGMEIEGRPEVVTVRGKVAARNGKFVGESGARPISAARAEPFLTFLCNPPASRTRTAAPSSSHM